jgi:Zn-dependent protease
MVNLSLFLFNLIPLGGLDGKYFLHSILGKASAEEVYNLDALERAETANDDQRGALESVITRGTGVLVALDSVLMVFALIRI